jgi:hypothetical protein
MKKVNPQKTKDAVKAINSEFFNSFMLFGTTLDGELQIIHHFNNGVDKLAINTLIERYYLVNRFDAEEARIFNEIDDLPDLDEEL